MFKVRITGELLSHMFTTGHLFSRIEVTDGLPENCRLLHAQMDELDQDLILYFMEPDGTRDHIIEKSIVLRDLDPFSLDKKVVDV